MKKILSLVLTLVMLASATAVTTSAAGTLYVNSDFSSMDTFTNHFHAGALYTENNLLFGYAEAKCLQSKGEWYQYDTAIEVALADDDLNEGDRGYSLWYCNINLEAYGRFDGTNYMCFGYDVENKECYLTASDLSTEEVKDIMPRVPFELSDEEFHTFGLSITAKRMRCFINDTLIFDFYDEADDYLIGRQDENTNPTPLVFWNDNNFIQIKNVKIASPEYLYPFAQDTETTETTSEPSGEITENKDNAGEKTEATTTRETTTRIESEVVTNKDGETSVVTKVVTEATTTPKAETNQNKPVGGNSTSTGDATFVVVAVMVATIGCAVIVKKVSVR